MAETEGAKKDSKDQQAQPAAQGAKPKKKLNIVLIAAIAVAVLASGGAGFMFFKGKGVASEKVQSEEAHEEAADEHPKEKEDEHPKENGSKGHGSEKASGGAGSLMKLEPFIVNLQDNSGTRYLKLTLNIELASNTSSAEIEVQDARIRDSVIVLLSSKSYTDIGTVEGKYQLRDEIVARINQYLTKGKVKTAYFTEFVIQ